MLYTVCTTLPPAKRKEERRGKGKERGKVKLKEERKARGKVGRKERDTVVGTHAYVFECS